MFTKDELDFLLDVLDDVEQELDNTSEQELDNYYEMTTACNSVKTKLNKLYKECE